MIGIDEAGRGAFAGPLVVASVVAPLSYDFGSLPIRDSKTLSPAQRERIVDELVLRGIQVETRVIDVADINRRGIGWANRFGIVSLIEDAKNRNATDAVIVDGRWRLEKSVIGYMDVRCVVRADATILPVMLAGIVAKVTRDRIMRRLHTMYPQYRWEKNKGYGTREHIQAIRIHGMCPEHRTQFVETALTKISSRVYTLE